MIATTDARGEEWGVENTVRSRFRREGERVRWKVDSRVEYKVILAGLLERIEPGNKRRRAKKGFRELYAFPRWKFIQKKKGGDGVIMTLLRDRYRWDMYTFNHALRLQRMVSLFF